MSVHPASSLSRRRQVAETSGWSSVTITRRFPAGTVITLFNTLFVPKNNFKSWRASYARVIFQWIFNQVKDQFFKLKIAVRLLCRCVLCGVITVNLSVLIFDTGREVEPLPGCTRRTRWASPPAPESSSPSRGPAAKPYWHMYTQPNTGIEATGGINKRNVRIYAQGTTNSEKQSDNFSGCWTRIWTQIATMKHRSIERFASGSVKESKSGCAIFLCCREPL